MPTSLMPFDPMNLPTPKKKLSGLGGMMYAMAVKMRDAINKKKQQQADSGLIQPTVIPAAQFTGQQAPQLLPQGQSTLSSGSAPASAGSSLAQPQQPYRNPFMTADQYDASADGYEMLSERWRKAAPKLPFSL